ncbi:hypothetical protein GJ496_003271 [Pomphorhynchus laevis]|nr:hypothetical protein GJ496_003271 [Pomphorhynchus laevis]
MEEILDKLFVLITDDIREQDKYEIELVDGKLNRSADNDFDKDRINTKLALKLVVYMIPLFILLLAFAVVLIYLKRKSSRPKPSEYANND